MVSAVHLGSGLYTLGCSLAASKGLHMVSAVHRWPLSGFPGSRLASKGLHMVSAVHPATSTCQSINPLPQASKGLHMVSAVHPSKVALPTCGNVASKGLHMVSAVHPGAFGEKDQVSKLQRGCTWLVQFIGEWLRGVVRRSHGFKGAAHG